MPRHFVFRGSDSERTRVDNRPLLFEPRGGWEGVRGVLPKGPVNGSGDGHAHLLDGIVRNRTLHFGR